MPIAEIPGGTISYEIKGADLERGRPPLALLLPQSSGPNGLRRLIDGLAEHHTVIAYDQRGTGGSSRAPDKMSMATQASDFIGLLDALEISEASLLCHSTGCGIGVTVAAEHHERIASLILASPWTHADEHLSTMQNLRIAAARALDPEQYARFNAALLFPPDYRRAHEVGFNQLIECAKPQNADVIAQRLHAILAFDARQLLSDIKTRTLTISAKDDQLMPVWFAAEAAQIMPQAELVELDGGGHMILETRASELVEAVTAFLAQ